MFENFFVVLLFVVFQQILGSHYNEWENNNNKHENISLVSVDGDYECDHNSYFQSISRSHEYRQHIYCNELFIQMPEKQLISYGLKNGHQFSLNQIDSYMAIKDQNGKEVFWRLGRVRGGECDGDLLFIESFNIPTKGSCDSYSGVTHMRSTKTVFALRGRCESTCFGHTSVHYEPGKRGIRQEKHH